MKRLPDWPARLAAFFAERQSTAFAWGSNDCATFAADAARAITGADPLAELRGTWVDEPGALAALAAAGGIANAATRWLPKLQSPRLAQRGDLVLVHALVPLEGNVRRHYAVCDSDRWAAPHRSGIVRGPMSAAVRAWGIGRA